MFNGTRRNAARTLLIVFLTHLVITLPARAQTQAEAYRIGAGDVLQLNVLERPQLDRELTVQPDGTAFVPQVGEVTIAGLTVAEAEALVRQKLRLFNPAIDEVTLQVSQYNALRIYVLGGVVNPGAHTFTSTPSIWDAIRAAGGPAENANLTAVRLVSRQGDRSQVRTVNVSGLLTGGDVPEIELQSGDTIIVPVAAEGATAPTVIAADGVQIIGAIATPTVVPIDAPTRLLSCLLMAGSTLETAQIDKVWWVHAEAGERYTSRRVDLAQFFERGSLAGNPLVYPGDAIRVEYRRPSWAREYLPLILATVSTAVTFFLAYDTLRNNNR
jgi:protein involved in polysaccharide export with SLBB domain